MRKRFVIKALVLLALLSAPMLRLQADTTWGNGQIITNAKSVVDENLGLSGTISLNSSTLGVYIIAFNQDVSVTLTADTIIQPYQNNNAHLIFYADSGKEITVNVDYDLTFIGETYGSDYTDMIVTFSGKGITRFKLKECYNSCVWRGTTVTFGSEGAAVCPGSDMTVAKTRVYIVMDQTKYGAIDLGQNKVIFQRSRYRFAETESGTEQDCDHCTTFTGDCSGFPTRVVVAPGSYITYLSMNITGTPGSPTADMGYGTLAFDPTHEGVGRMVLEIQGDPGDVSCTTTYNCTYCGNNTDRTATNYRTTHNFYDGGVVVAGHYVEDFSESNIRSNVYLNSHAGVRAIFRIIDDLAYGQNGAGYTPSDSDRRGLLILNLNTTIPQLASDPYGQYNLWGLAPNSTTNPHPCVSQYWADNYSWYKAQNNKYATNPLNVRTGFILGINGWVDIYHKTFLDYVACHYGVPGELDYFTVQDFGDYVYGDYVYWEPLIDSTKSYPAMFKWKNPAAFYVDGLNYYSNYNDLQGAVGYRSGYSGYATPGDVCAQICCYGDAGAFFRIGNLDQVSLSTTNSSNHYQNTGFGPWPTSSGSWVYTFTIDRQQYNGEYIPSSLTLPTNNTDTGEGLHVIDIEGKLRVDSFDADQTPGVSGGGENYRSYGGDTSPDGFINMPTVTIDYKGDELGDTGSATSRPLTRNAYYSIYQSPSWFINDTVELYNTRYEHNDVVKVMTTDPYWAPPAILGGERLYVANQMWSTNSSDDYWAEHFEHPKFFLYDSYVNLHESLVSSGIRWVVSEERKGNDLSFWGYIYGTAANNTSTITCFDHGDDYDTLQKGYGRLFMVGSGRNLMANDSSNWATEYGFINVYRGRDVDRETPADTITLSLQSAFEQASIHDTSAGSVVFRAPLIGYTDHEIDRAHHLILLSRNSATTGGVLTGGASYVSLGWTFTVGSDTMPPWKAMSNSNLGNYSDQFAIDINSVTPATLSIDGNYFYFGGTDYNGNKAILPVVTKEQGSVIYVNHGGRITITQPLSGGLFDTNEHGYDCFVDLPIAYRLWSDYTLSGIIDLPKDQVTYGDSCCSAFGRQPYDLNTSTLDEDLHLMVWNERKTPDIVPTGRTQADRLSGEEFILAWNARPYQQRSYDASFIPVKSFQTRHTAVVDSSITKPSNLLYFDSNDHVTQLKVSGATMADPLHLLITGSSDKHKFGWVKEIVSLRSNPEVWGEGDHAIIFLNNDGRVGLGKRYWNDLSEDAWCILGKDFVTIAPDGNGWVDVHSDLLVADRGAIVPTDDFSLTTTHRLTFYSDDVKEIRIPAGGELDLSAFGKLSQQEIVFGGKVRLIFEPGSTLRFPDLSSQPDTIKAPILYMNDDSELIFEGDHQLSKGRYATMGEADADKIKIIGYGNIWLNKNAQMKVMRSANVSVQSNASATTDVTISIQRQGALYIGDENMAGGAFEVGNPVNRDSSGVNFTLQLNGPDALFHTDREGFFGLGVGVINKSGIMNGAAIATYDSNDLYTSVNPYIEIVNSTTTTLTWDPSPTAWQIQTLHNVVTVTLKIDSNGGVIEHNNIFDGSDRRASLWAIGPVIAAGSYNFEVSNPTYARIRGGGNLMSLSPIDPTDPTTTNTALVNMWDYADNADRSGYGSQGTRYAIMGSWGMIKQTLSTDISNAALSSTANGGQIFSGGAGDYRDFFTYLSYPLYRSLGVKLVCFSLTEFQEYMAYINASAYVTPANKYPNLYGEIVRATDINIIGLGDPARGLEMGVLGSPNSNDADPLTVVGRR